MLFIEILFLNRLLGDNFNTFNMLLINFLIKNQQFTIMKTNVKLILLLILISFWSCEKSEISSVAESESIDRGKDSDKKDKDCETAFAFDKQAMCFLDDDDLNSNRWGWTIGPISAPHSETYGIFQGAGQCNLNNGELVGSLTINYQEDGSVSVDFNALDGYGFFETHLFIGNEKYPRKNNGSFTVAPGQYPYGNSYSEGTSSDSFTADGFEDEIFVIAHSVVCSFEDSDPCVADAGLIKPDAPKYCYNETGDTIISATPDGDAIVPEGFEVLYVLTEGPELVILEVNNEPNFGLDIVGEFTIHTLVYDPATLDLGIVSFGVTTGFDIINYIEANDICASLDGVGAQILIEKCEKF